MTMNLGQTTPPLTLQDSSGNTKFQVDSTGAITTPTTFSNSITFNHLILGNGQFINPQNLIMAINYSNPTTQYVIYNATTNTPIVGAASSNAAYTLQKGINAMSNSREGVIFIHSGNYTLSTQVLVNKSGITIQGAGQGGGVSGDNSGTVFNCNLDSSTDCILLTKTSGTVYFDNFNDFSITRQHYHSARYLISCLTPHQCQHMTFNRVETFDMEPSNYADINMQGTDAIYFNNGGSFRGKSLVGNETLSGMFYSSSNIQIFITNWHFRTNGALASPPDGLQFGTVKDTEIMITQSTFDSLRYPILGVNQGGNVVLNGVAFNRNTIQHPFCSPPAVCKISGTWYTYTSGPGSNMIPALSNMTISNDNNFTDAQDRSKALQFSLSGLTANHIQTKTWSNGNYTVIESGTSNTYNNNQLIEGGGSSPQFAMSMYAPILLITNTQASTSAFRIAPANTGIVYLQSGTSNTSSTAPTYFANMATTAVNFAISPVASSANFLQVTGATAGNSPSLQAAGASTNANIILQPKGNGKVQITDGTDNTKKVSLDASGITTAHRQNYTLPNANGTLSLQPRFNGTSNTSNGTATSSATLVMLGAHTTLNPRFSTNATVSVSGVWENNLSGGGCTADIRYGTGAAPSNGAAVTGTKLGNDMKEQVTLVLGNTTFSKTVIANNVLTPGTLYWFDLAFSRGASGTCHIYNVDWAVREQ